MQNVWPAGIKMVREFVGGRWYPGWEELAVRLIRGSGMKLSPDEVTLIRSRIRPIFRADEKLDPVTQRTWSGNEPSKHEEWRDRQANRYWTDENCWHVIRVVDSAVYATIGRHLPLDGLDDTN